MRCDAMQWDVERTWYMGRRSGFVETPGAVDRGSVMDVLAMKASTRAVLASRDTCRRNVWSEHKCSWFVKHGATASMQKQ
jgi:hypothetical protein